MAWRVQALLQYKANQSRLGLATTTISLTHHLLSLHLFFQLPPVLSRLWGIEGEERRRKHLFSFSPFCWAFSAQLSDNTMKAMILAGLAVLALAKVSRAEFEVRIFSFETHCMSPMSMTVQICFFFVWRIFPPLNWRTCSGTWSTRRSTSERIIYVKWKCFLSIYADHA